MSERPTRDQADLADVLELVLDKGIVVNADIAVTIGDTEMLGVEIRAAIASFETAAEYGLAFPSGTDMRRVERASGRESLDEGAVDLGIDASDGGSETQPPEGSSGRSPGPRPDPRSPVSPDESTDRVGSPDGDDAGGSGDEAVDGDDDAGAVGGDAADADDGDDGEVSDDSDGGGEPAGDGYADEDSEPAGDAEADGGGSVDDAAADADGGGAGS